MKLIYQQMLAFFGVIFVAITIVSGLFIRSTTNQVWEQSFQQLERYTDVLKDSAVDSRTYLINTNFIAHAEEILSGQNVHFLIYDAKNQIRYPNIENSEAMQIDARYWKKLQDGKAVSVPSTGRDPRNGDEENITIYYKPVFEDGKLLFVISAFSPVDNIQSSLKKTKSNLAIAFVLSTLAAVVVSYFLARYQVSRINRLRQVTHQVAEGNYDVDVAVKSRSHDEVAQLSDDFKDMIESLRESRAEIQRQEERRRQFMADAAHEMRTPLTTINGLLEGLAYDAIPKESRGQSIELMRDETNRLIRLVNENLDYEKIRSNQIPLFKQTFNAAKTLATVIDQLSVKATTAGDILVLDAPDDVPIYADHDRFVQVVVNIIQNAIQFTQDGTITVSAELAEHATVITISDTGIGMTDDQMKNIWERYYKADASRKSTKYGESGLGLAIAHQLVTIHGGTINVSSTLGKGTTFTVTFPDEESSSESTDSQPD